MTRYKICDDASQDNTTIEAATAAQAVEEYLIDGYQTVTAGDEPVPAGERYAEITAWSDDDTCELLATVTADGVGGIGHVSYE